MKKAISNRSFYILMIIMVAFMLLMIVHPAGIMCENSEHLFSTENGSDAATAFTEIATFYRKWCWIPFLAFAVIGAFCHNDNVKKGMFSTCLTIIGVLILCVNPTFTINTIEHVAGWFSGGLQEDNSSSIISGFGVE